MTDEQRKKANEIKAKMQLEVENTDPESAHGNADDLLCELLVEFGCEDVVEVFNNVHKWYA